MPQFERLKATMYRELSETIFEMSRCFDVYRLETLASRLIMKMRNINNEAADMVKTLEQ